MFIIQLRKQLNDKTNYLLRSKIIKVLEDKNIAFVEKQNKIAELLKQIAKDYATFQDIEPSSVHHLVHLYSCMNTNTSKLCIRTQDGSKRFVFPRYNLVERSKRNETNYFLRFAGELIQNVRIRNMILQPKLLFYRGIDTGMKKNENEIIILESEIRSYFSNNDS